MELDYRWLEALHIIAVIAWCAGLLYLPRLFVYHADVSVGSESDLIFRNMERKLLRFIMNPAMIIVLFLGLLLLLETEALSSGMMWIHIKLSMVVLLFACHGMMAKYRKDFEKGINKRSAKFYRIFNEIPAVLIAIIVIMAVVKPV